MNLKSMYAYDTKKTFCKIVGLLHLLLATFLLLPLPWCFYFEWDPYLGKLFLGTSLFIALTGIVLRRYGKGSNEIFFPRTAILIVAYAWLALGIVGALPYWESNAIPRFVDALFESVSGFTTTGSSILNNIEALPPALQFWRGLTHWIGGLGVVVLFVSVFPNLGVGSKMLFKTESVGPTSGEVTPRIRDTSRNLWYTYAFLTALEATLLWLAGMAPLDAIVHSFSTMASGGFSTKNGSVADFHSPMIEWIIIVFMFFAAVNFGLYYLLVKGRWKAVLKDAELRFFITVIIIFCSVSTISLWLRTDYDFLHALRSATFQLMSIISTTGFASDDYELYAYGPQFMIFLCLLMGGMAGSTAGGLKQFRVFLMFKIIANNIRLGFTPSLVTKLRVGTTLIHNDLLHSVLGFFCVYMTSLALGSLFLAYRDNDLLTSLTAVMTCLSGTGPGFGTVGPMENFAHFDDPSKLALCVMMLLGRLEFFVLLALFHNKLWKP
ncbi:MAG: TrkH family potassium uptake protein [SAR324 cluster bacterium]|nr:TrkH family potassium uptake protein [SAR324 cluster bacterium]